MIASAAKLRPAIRILALWLALAGVLGLAVASASPAHGHSAGPASGCNICFVAHLAALEPAPPHAIFALEYRERAAFPLNCSGYARVSSTTSFTRGPPAL